MIELIQAVLLGVVQGLTEFLPISSSGHLLLGQYFLGMDQEKFGLSFDVALHLGTLVAVVSFFRRELLRLALGFLRSLRAPSFSDPDQRLAYLILAATFPAAVIGFLFEDFFSSSARSPWVVVAMLVVVGILLIVGEKVGRMDRQASKMSFLGAVGVGCAQAAALIPGVSRSGATITLGLFLGLTRREAARFSFLMSVPIITGAGSLEMAGVLREGMDVPTFGVGFLTSAVVGYFTIKYFLVYLARHSLRAFAYYRFGLAAVVAAVLLLTGF
ncbi:undecaprenyl-diphosphatase UppP [Rubrobacter taiwanensis]|uniref:undecaprenyl-diphosphatase UppP n=1 Tax=Rubrobacter taiwanensis TaxID=185139 RepID=UPI001405492A|nr:undecaprenyl-diphosphatase UppP [Rubrobacter taiwanensis]